MILNWQNYIEEKVLDDHVVDHHEPKPLPGWMCIGVGVGFVVLVVLGLVAVRVFS